LRATGGSLSELKMRSVLALVVLVIMGVVIGAPAATEAPREATAATTEPVIQDGLTVAVAGDLIGPYHSVLGLNDAGFAGTIALIKGADVAFANQEGSIFDLETFKGTPAAENGGGYPLQSVAIGRELKEMGFSLLSKANNHATDWGLEGLAATEASLKELGIAYAGSGDSEAAARR